MKQMWGPSKGDMQLLLGLAAVGLLTVIFGGIGGLIWLALHVHLQ
jgi:hypothetical protein